MARCIAFLRAVNVGGRTVRMDALRAAFETLDLSEVRTFIASGNVVFGTRARDPAALTRRIEACLHAAFGFEVQVFLRTDAELAALVAHPAFDPAATAATATHVVGLLSTPPGAAAGQALRAFESATDRFALHGRELYWLSTHRQSESRFSNAAFEKALNLRATFRGMGTLRRLLATLA
jgi:uncharacterized protein (DUF1697 family)